MGKTKKWVKELFKGKNGKEKKQSSQTDSLTGYDVFTGSALVYNQVPLPETLNDKRAWTFRRLPRSVPAVLPVDYEVPESWIKQKKVVAVEEAAAVTNHVVPEWWNERKEAVAIEAAAVVTIQSAFRSFLARKALKALKGLVKVQALVRGYLVRKRTRTTLRCIQSLVTAQARALSQRIRLADESNSSYWIQSSHQERDWGMDENIRIVEMDPGESRRSPRDRKNLSSYPQTAQSNHRSTRGASKSSMMNGPDSKQEHQNFPPKQSALVDSSLRAQSSPKHLFTPQSSPKHAYSKQERQNLSPPQPSALVDSSPRADDYYLKRAQSSPHGAPMMAPGYTEHTEASKAKLRRSRSTPGSGSSLGRSGRKMAPQAGTRHEPNVDLSLAKLSRVGGSGKKRDYGSSPSRTILPVIQIPSGTTDILLLLPANKYPPMANLAVRIGIIN